MLRPLPQTRKATRTCEAYMPRHIPNSEKPSQPSEGPTDLKALKEPFKPYTLARPLRGGDRRPEVLRAQRARTQPPKIGFPQPCGAALELNCKGRMNPVERKRKVSYVFIPWLGLHSVRRVRSYRGPQIVCSVHFAGEEPLNLCEGQENRSLLFANIGPTKSYQT